MSRKIDLLYEKIFTNFITGVYGPPKIPNEREIMLLISTITDDNSDPITKRTHLDDIYIEEIHNTFDDIMDDLDILYKSIEDQSNDILDQLTNSLKEHNGVKRELRNIEQRADDIAAGKTGEDYIQYVHTENFTSLDNINVAKTTTDPNTKAPVVDIKSGRMYIPNSLMNLIDLTHYYERKLDISNTDFVGHIVEAGYVGSSDAATILNVADDRRLMYRIKTDTPTSMKSSFIIQLDSSRKERTINGIAIVLDADNTKGILRVQYKTDVGWEDIPDFPAQDIVNDKLLLRFEDITTTHIKFQFIKETPDLLDSNEYFIVLNDISIFEALSHKTSTYYSKSIQLEPYDKERPVVGNIAVDAKGIIPDGTAANVYVAKDKRIRGYFKNRAGDYVSPDSVNVYEFVPDLAGEFEERHILLSDIKNHLDAVNIEDYRTLEFDWKIVKSFDSSDNLKPAVINFVGANTNDPFDNSMFQEAPYLFGDVTYQAGYPQPDYPQPLEQWFLSGVVNESNPYWDPWMSGLVASGLLIYGIDYGDPTGYPFNYYRTEEERTLRFGDSYTAINGWWRPDSELITPSGSIVTNIEDPLPDFQFNGIRFYRVFKFEPDSEVVGSTIKLYTYQTRPVTGGDNDYYPHNMIWNYNTRDVINNIEIDTSKSNPFTGEALSHIPALDDFTTSAPPGTGMFELPMPSGATLIANSVRDTSYVNHNNILEVDTHYTIEDNGGKKYMNMLPVGRTNSYLPNAHVYTKYSYKTQDKYSSYWNGYIIADSNSTITIKQHTDNDVSVINKVLIQDLDGKLVSEFTPSDENVPVNITKGVYKLKIFCLTDPFTNYAAKNWSPYSKDFIETGIDLKVVPTIDPVKIIDFDILLHSTTYENDNRAAIIETGDNYKYVVVKEPSKKLMPGYYYDKSKSAYINNAENYIKNIGHYRRRYIQSSGPSGFYIESFITGSKGSIVMSGEYLTEASYVQDNTWNDGSTYPPDFDNYDPNKLYVQHSTYNNPINIEDATNNKGHLFYNTGENLPAFYTINYGIVDRNDPTVDRFLYKIQLNSEHEKNTPILESIKFTINVEEEEVTT